MPPDSELVLCKMSVLARETIRRLHFRTIGSAVKADRELSRRPTPNNDVPLDVTSATPRNVSTVGKRSTSENTSYPFTCNGIDPAVAIDCPESPRNATRSAPLNRASGLTTDSVVVTRGRLSKDVRNRALFSPVRGMDASTKSSFGTEDVVRNTSTPAIDPAVVVNSAQPCHIRPPPGPVTSSVANPPIGIVSVYTAPPRGFCRTEGAWSGSVSFPG